MDETSVRNKMQSVIGIVASEMSSIRTGRATPGLVENMSVAVYGGQQTMRIQELGSVTAPDTQTIVISPWDKSIIGDIRKGILEANVGMNPSIDGEILRISFAPLTTEDREKYVKLLSAKLENGRVMVRQVRADEMHMIKSSFEKKVITEDEKFAQEKKIQELTDEYIGKIDSMGEEKKKELLSL